MCKSLGPLLALVVAITDQVGSFVFVENGQPKGPIVQLFEWRFDDIAEECEQFLGPNGYGGVQVSPVTESISLDGDPWHERYQPISYKLRSRSGNKHQFKDMVRRCGQSQVKVYVEVVINHMTKKYESKVYGTDYSYAFPDMHEYPQIPYLPEDFRSSDCNVTDYNNATQVRECAVDGLLELDQSKLAVRCKISQLLNELLEIGVAGFSFSHAKYMWPGELRDIIGRLDYLSGYQGFREFENPFIYQEFVEGGAVKPSEYYDLGLVTDFKYSFELSQVFSGKKDLKELKNLGGKDSLILSERALVFVENHLTQRGQGFEGAKSLSFKQAKRYTLANVFMLAWPRGQPRIMSGYEFKDADQGPPRDEYGGIARVQPQDNGTCANGWTCEHRWLLISQMVKFTNYIQSLPVENWWDNGKNQIAFSRGDKGFIVFNLDSTDMNKLSLQTGLPPGSYCDIFSGYRTTGGQCKGKEIVVGLNGKARISLTASDEYGVIAVSQQDWLPHVPVSLTQETDSEADQETGSANAAGTQATQTTDEQKTGKQGSGSDEQATESKSKTNSQVNPDAEEQHRAGTGNQQTDGSGGAKVPSVDNEDAKAGNGESTNVKEGKKSISKRSSLYEDDTRTIAKREVQATDTENDEDGDEEDDKDDEEQKAPSKQEPGKQGVGNQEAGEKNAGKQGTGKQGAGEQDAGKQGAAKQGGGEQDAAKQGTSKQGAGEQDAGKQGTGKQGAGEQNAGKQGIVKQGAGEQDAGKQGTGKQGAGEQNAGKQGIVKQRAGEQDAGKQGTGKQGAGEQNAGKQGIVKQGADEQDGGKQGIVKQGADEQDGGKQGTGKHGAGGQDASKQGTGKQGAGEEEVQSSGKEDTMTTNTQNSPKSDKQISPGADRVSQNVAEQKKAEAPEVRELPILGRPRVSHANIFDIPRNDGQQMLYSGDRSWKQYYTAVNHTAYIKYTRVVNLVDNDQRKIIHSFHRRAFVLINRGHRKLSQVSLETGLPVGLYCDVVTGTPAEDANCTGKQILIDRHSVGTFTLDKESGNDMTIVRPQNRKNLRHLYIPQKAHPEGWREAYKTVKFSIQDQTDRYYKDIPDDHYAMQNRRRGFMIFKSGHNDKLNVSVQTGLPAGRYCDMISGILSADGLCSGKNITVQPGGVANFTFSRRHQTFVVHEGAMIENLPRDFGSTTVKSDEEVSHPENDENQENNKNEKNKGNDEESKHDKNNGNDEKDGKSKNDKTNGSVEKTKNDKISENDENSKTDKTNANDENDE